ncbi:MAG TPA: hypothetical protein VIG79_11415 [Lapillicoccus sp.]|jgi:hypothetical protein|uniref:hypothetical protein n=1 Tax=Lapillicoccus sp. TaxID=1909287 RepID=UPI002F9451C7
MTGGTDRSLEELLREQLHEMDTVEPPDPDFEFRALRAGRERLKRRQAWTRGLVGAAAAIAIGAVAIPSLGRLGTVTGGSSSGSAVAGAGSAPSAPEAATDGDARQLKAPDAGAAPDGSSLDSVPDSLRTTVARLRTTLSAPPYDAVFTSLTFDPSVAPSGRVVLHLTRPDPAAIDLVRSAFPNGPEVTTEVSAYSLGACTQTWAKLAADPQLHPQDVPLTVLGCDANGRVAVRVPPGAPAATLDQLTSYGDAVNLVSGG